VRQRRLNDIGEFEALLLPLQLRSLPGDVQFSATVLALGNVIPILGMYLLGWDAYYMLLLFLCEAFVALFRDYIMAVWNAGKDSIVEMIFAAIFMSLFYGFLAVPTLYFGFYIIIGFFGPEELKGAFAALLSEPNMGLVIRGALELLLEHLRPMWVPVGVLIANQIYAIVSTRARALREGKPFRPRTHNPLRWYILVIILGSSIALFLPLGSPLYGVAVFLIVKIWADLTDYILDYLHEETEEE